jgi:DNA-binding CsgD family transcriptional regulator
MRARSGYLPREESKVIVMVDPEIGRTGWASLSPTQRSIAWLVRDALTNQQIARRMFISPHTVNYHLREIFRKLGINSRVELARIVQQVAGQRRDQPGTPGPLGA